MKQYEVIGYGWMEFFKEWSIYLGAEFLQMLVGCAWIGICFSFLGFIYCYLSFYRKGKSDRSYWLAYQDLDKVARQVVFGFIMFLVMTIAAS